MHIFYWSLVIGRLKSQKTDCSKPHQDLGRIRIQFWRHGDPLFSPTKINFKPQVTAKHTLVDRCIQTARAPCFGWSKTPCRMRGQSWLSFAGSISEPTVTSWSEINLQQLFLAGLMISDVNFNFSCFAHNHRFFLFFSAKSGSLLFLHHWDTVCHQNLTSRALCPLRCSKNVQHWTWSLVLHHLRESVLHRVTAVLYSLHKQWHFSQSKNQWHGWQLAKKKPQKNTHTKKKKKRREKHQWNKACMTYRKRRAASNWGRIPSSSCSAVSPSLSGRRCFSPLAGSSKEDSDIHKAKNMFYRGKTV